MKIILAASLLLVGTIEAKAQTLVQSFDDIAFWTGNGTNLSALVVEFNSSTNPFSVVWGYKWSGGTNLQTMVFDLAGVITGGPADVAGSDSRLSISVTDFGGLGYNIDALTYDQSGLGGAWPLGTLNLGGWDGTNWNNLFTFAGTSAWPSTSFHLSEVGMADTSLVNGGWYGWILSDGPQTYHFAQPFAAPVPEPSVAILGLVALVFLMLRWLKMRAQGSRLCVRLAEL
jgi:hypothetical protein